jgi:hypothetical protein
MSWATGNAAPMSISYTANDAGGSLWAYDFAVLFDNNDGTWIAGQQFDYLTFGNQQSETGQYGAFGDWTWTATPTIASPNLQRELSRARPLVSATAGSAARRRSRMAPGYLWRPARPCIFPAYHRRLSATPYCGRF